MPIAGGRVPSIALAVPKAARQLAQFCMQTLMPLFLEPGCSLIGMRHGLLQKIASMPHQIMKRGTAKGRSGWNVPSPYISCRIRGGKRSLTLAYSTQVCGYIGYEGKDGSPWAKLVGRVLQVCARSLGGRHGSPGPIWLRRWWEEEMKRDHRGKRKKYPPRKQGPTAHDAICQAKLKRWDENGQIISLPSRESLNVHFIDCLLVMPLPR